MFGDVIGLLGVQGAYMGRAEPHLGGTSCAKHLGLDGRQQYTPDSPPRRSWPQQPPNDCPGMLFALSPRLVLLT